MIRLPPFFPILNHVEIINECLGEGYAQIFEDTGSKAADAPVMTTNDNGVTVMTGPAIVIRFVLGC